MKAFERTKTLLQQDYEKLSSLSVCVIGLGGVGGYVVEALVRLGIRKIVLVDFDIVDITNINRQIIATKDTIGMLKTEAYANRIHTISDTCEVHVISQKITKENIACLLDEDIDFYVDACDDIPVKCELLKQTLTRGKKLIMSMGTANKLDATSLTITTLDKTSYDPIAKRCRKYMRENHLKGKVPVVSSTEPPKKQEGLGTVSYLPAVAGLLIVNAIVKEVLT